MIRPLAFAATLSRLLLCATLTLGLCAGFAAAGCSQPPEARAAEAALTLYVDATAEPFRVYVNTDPALTADQKARRFQSIDAATAYVSDIRRRQAPTALDGVTR